MENTDKNENIYATPDLVVFDEVNDFTCNSKEITIKTRNFLQILVLVF